MSEASKKPSGKRIGLMVVILIAAGAFFGVSWWEKEQAKKVAAFLNTQGDYTTAAIKVGFWDKSIVITGASAGIGRELVYAVDKDARYDEIWVIARRKERLENMRSGIRTEIRPLPLDLTDPAAIGQYAQALQEEKPNIAVLVNAAASLLLLPAADAFDRSVA